ncbi:hypothetical protein [Blastococcus goldschmidtiae]|uniref:Uncharacterized protein n=1 Tax=Blastococcus goldschmidtiae TaxID=3075546 RepID=A0ABU2K3B6_9ACTN|nr:hypothetical protein [Blastococcus sp. DSM 46792]MDT0274688.1 hypothetical protein [Blastococcus sp. DSM 46792]
MTSDQSGRYGEPTGRPEDGSDGPPQQQGWNAPPPQQGWNAPPPQQGGWNAPPPGWQPQDQQWSGYAAPYVPPPPPGSAERPLTVRAGIGAFVVNFVLGLVSALVAFADIDGLVRQAALQTNDPDVSEEVLRTAILLFAGIGLVLVVLHALFIWWAWRGRNWARIMLWVLGGLAVLSGFSTLGGGTGATDFLTALSVFQLLALIAGIVLLALKPSNEWYRYTGWARTYGQQR